MKSTERTLEKRLKRADRNIKIRAALLIAPLLIFIISNFAWPIGQFLTRSVDNSLFYEALPRTMSEMEAWDSKRTLPESAYSAVAYDIKESFGESTLISRVARALNYRLSGARGDIFKTGRALKQIPIEDFPNIKWEQKLIEINNFWGEPLTWINLKEKSGAISYGHYLQAVDRDLNENFQVVQVNENTQIHILLFKRTFVISAIITFLCLVLGYPLAYFLASLPIRISNLLMICVLLPFWTSLLVRTSSWIVILQEQGVINSLLVWIGIISDDNRFALINNQTGTIIAMTHILLPFMILPLYSVMKGISPSYVRAARSLGAHSFRAFFNIYAPQTLPGIGAGGVLVFILSIGYYITPALVGGSTGQLISNIIAYHMRSSLNWGLAASLSAILLLLVILLYILSYCTRKVIESYKSRSGL